MQLVLSWLAFVLILPLITGKRGGGGARPRPRAPYGRKPSKRKPRSKQPKKRKASKPSKKKGKKSDKTGKGKQSKKKSQKSKKDDKTKQKKKKDKKSSKSRGGGDGDDGGGDDDTGGGDVADSPPKPEQEPEEGAETGGEQSGEPTSRRKAVPIVPVKVTPEVMEMRERRRQSRFKSDEINAKITLEQLKDENGQPRFSSARFGAVFLLPESCAIQKVQSIKEEEDVQSQSD